MEDHSSVSTTLSAPTAKTTEPSVQSAKKSATSASSKIEEGAETHTCPYKDCGKYFSKKYNLKAHLRLHTGEQPFECPRPDCNKKFKWRSSLSSHSIWHSRKDAGTASANIQSNSKPSSPKTGVRAIGSHVSKPAVTEQLQKKGDNQSASATSVKPLAISETSSAKKKRPRNAHNPVVAPKAELSSAKTEPFLYHGYVGRCESGDQMNLRAASAVISQAATQAVDTNACAPLAKRPKTVSTQQSRQSAVVSAVPRAEPFNSLSLPVNVPVTMVGGTDLWHLETAKESVVPASPVTSDEDDSEKCLDAELFNGSLPPLTSVTVGDSGKLSEDVLLAGTDVEAILNDGSEMFGCVSPSTEALQNLDTRFGSFELDNFQSFCLGKVEGL